MILQTDRLAQNKLYDSYRPALLSLCGRIIQDTHRSEELVNDAFLKIFNSLHKYDFEKASLYTWMRKITLNTVFSSLRKERVEMVDEVPDGEHEAEAYQNITVKEFQSLLHKLPPTTRLVFSLYVIDGFSHSEIGKILNISEGTSRWHLSDAKKRLKELFTY